MGEELFQGDETRWEVFEEVQGKVGHRGYRWVTRSASVVFSPMAPSRGAEVPKAYFAELHKDLVAVGLVGDRYSAYKSFAKGQAVSILAYCWAHVRRDFLQVARSWPERESWGERGSQTSAPSTGSIPPVSRCGRTRCRSRNNHQPLASVSVP